jgi:Fic family protein
MPLFKKLTMSYIPTEPFNQLPDLPPKADIETKPILKKVISASRALSELKGSITNLPNPFLFIDTINLQEAQASSEIENIVTTQDALFQASIAEKKIKNQATKEVIHYKDALWQAVNQINEKPILTTNLFIAIVQIIKENQSGIRSLPGTQLKNPKTDEVIYTPPEGENIIRDKLKALENFINIEDDIDPLIKLALIHYQFEAIHPFYDGNGRTGRIILLLYLKISGLMDLPALYLSKYILNNKSEYYINLRNVTENGDWETWILYILDMIEVTAQSGRERIEKIEALMKQMGEEIQKELPKVYSKDLLEILFKLPYVKRNFLEKAGLGNIKTSGNYLKSLEEKGFLKSVIVGKEKLYLNSTLMEILKEK